MTKAKELLFNLILLGVVVFIFLVFLEFGLRIFYPQSLSIIAWDDDVGNAFVPNAEVTRYDTSGYLRGEYVYDAKINSDGLRDKEYGKERSEKPRFIFLGDSMTFGEGVNKPFMDVLEEDFYNSEVEALNFGYYGTAIDYYYRKLLYQGLEYEPDVVFVTLFVGNDLDYVIDLGRRPVKDSTLYNPVILSCFHNLHLCPFFYSSYIKIKHSSLKPSSCDKEAFVSNHELVLESFDSSILEFKKLADENNFGLVYLLIPVREDVDDLKYDEWKATASDCVFGREQVQEEIITYLNSREVAVLDFTLGLKEANVDNSFYFPRDGHLNQEGHNKLAELLFDYLENGEEQIFDR